MADLEHNGALLVESLRQHVLTPLSDAQSIVQRECKEVEIERQAFQRFNERVADMDTVSPPGAMPRRPIVTRDTDIKPGGRLRRAYRETVMNVPHYDDVYGESLDANLAAELSAEVATGLQSDCTPFTNVYKTRLIAAVKKAIAQREAFYDRLKEEQDSLGKGQEKLGNLLDQLDGPRIPPWYTAEFEDRLSDLAQTRQETLRTRTRLRHLDGHDLCTYLYREPEWTYPVLTAVARLRGAVDYRT